MAIWRRDEPASTAPSQPAPSNHAPASAVPKPAAAGSKPKAEKTGAIGALRERQAVSTIGPAVVVKGELSGDEELVIEGAVDGTINLNQSKLTVGQQGKVSAQVTASTVVVLGQVTGSITAAEAVRIRETGKVQADISAPRVAIDDRADFSGAIDMRRPESA